MKKGIFVALAALALTVFAVPDAHAWWWHKGPDVAQRLSGSAFVDDVEVVDEMVVTKASVNLLAKGQPGTGQVLGRVVYESPLVPDPDPDLRCPKEFPFGANLISLDFVETFKDGSLLIGEASSGQAVCSNGLTNIVEVVGTITRGTGRFKGKSGTWEVEASTPAGPDAGATGSFIADLN